MMPERTSAFHGPLIPPPELAPSLPDHLTPGQCVESWLDLVETCHLFLIAGLRGEAGTNDQLKTAYREWYRDYVEQHDKTIRHMLERLDRASKTHDCQSPH